jgi:hypothetical protein
MDDVKDLAILMGALMGLVVVIYLAVQWVMVSGLTWTGA